MADGWWAEQEMFGAVTDETGEPMTTDADRALARLHAALTNYHNTTKDQP